MQNNDAASLADARPNAQKSRGAPWQRVSDCPHIHLNLEKRTAWMPEFPLTPFVHQLYIYGCESQHIRLLIRKFNRSWNHINHLGKGS